MKVGEVKPGEQKRGTDSVRCPKCYAEPGRPCVTPSGVVRYDYPHLARKKEWEKVVALMPLAKAMAKSGAASRV